MTFPAETHPAFFLFMMQVASQRLHKPLRGHEPLRGQKPMRGSEPLRKPKPLRRTGQEGRSRSEGQSHYDGRGHSRAGVAEMALFQQRRDAWRCYTCQNVECRW